MVEKLGERQKQLLRLLLGDKSGLTVDELSKALEITRNAVRQHLAALEAGGLVAPGVTRPSGGRPEQLYVLTEPGMEIFPRQYSWFAQLVVDSIRREHGTEGLGERLRAVGTEIAKQLRGQHPGLKTRKQKVARLAQVMDELGYQARPAAGEATVIEADNCVYHSLAMQNPEVCQLDLALLEGFTDSRVDHQECMARGGNVCRFKFRPKG